ncbi:MAG: glycoside hydrolase family 2 [Prevotella sp.]|jgi:hypothetical protein|nr:glycoside hydrolase family 2 [Prevotella sp.]
MKRLFAILLVLGFILASCTDGNSGISDRDLEKAFVNPLASVQTSVYWYWISGNISKEGVIKDLESMKEAGINRAFIGNIGLTPQETPPGKIKLLTDEWFEVVHAALKRATELDIEIGMFNCPGWSQAGGPWIKPEQAMRYLASTKTKVTGGQKVSMTLAKPEGDFQDVKVLAFPYNKEYELQLTTKNATVKSTNNDAKNILDGDLATEITFANGDPVQVDVVVNSDFTLRNITVVPKHHPIRGMVELQVKENNDYRSISKFEVSRYNASTEVGFVPYAPIVITTPKTIGKEFRLIFTGMNPNSGIKEIELSSMPKVEKYAEKTLAKMFQEPLPYWHEYQWQPQAEIDDSSLAVDPEKIIDITQYLSGNQLEWDAPEGDWIVMRSGMLPTQVMNGPAAPEGLGLEIDKLTSDYLQHHFDNFLGKVIERIPAEDRKSLKVVVSDSYEKGGQNFSDKFLEEFKTRYGYDALPFLPVYEGIVVKSQDMSDRFLWDMRRFVADKLSYAHIGGMREIAHKYGLTLWLENYGHWGFPGEFLQYGGQSDEVSGEFWSEGTLGDIENRAASSCAHIYGKAKVSAESFTAGGNAYGRYPAMMKQRGDRFFAEGINNTLLHVYISQYEKSLPPGTNAWFGNEFNRLNTWYSQLDLFTDYIKRSNFMLQQGLNVADVAYFIGEDAPKMTGVTDPALPKGYQFDYINAEVILNNMSVKDGLLTLPHGTQYKMLVLPKLETMRPELLTKIKQLVSDGGIVLGPAPSRSPSLEGYPQADEKVKTLTSELWGSVDGVNTKHATFGQGIIMSGMTMDEALAQINCVPDCKVPDNIPVHYGHRDLGKTQVYFLTNQSDKPITFDAELRVKDMRPEFWQPTTGKIRKLPVYTLNEETTTVPLKLEPLESAFIVFRDKADSSGEGDVNRNFPIVDIVTTIDSPWTLSFGDSERGPKESVTLNKLIDLSTSEDDLIKHYSGTMIYETTFNLDKTSKGGKTYINLNDVAVMGKVYVNGKYAGGVWTAPYRVDITDCIKNGENSLKVEVVNTWVNRLIGDSKLPKEQRKTETPNSPWNPDSPLQKTGLIGPVTIENVNY